MCGQAGVVFGTKRRTQEEIDYLIWVFTRLLELSEERGPHATGIAWVNREGKHRLFKRPVSASEFVRDKAFGEALGDVDNGVTVLMGHTRFVTCGDAAVNENNHPLRTGDCLVTHNGTVLNADYLFHRFRFGRHAEVDSEIIGRIADASIVDGRIDVKALRDRLALCRGQMSAVIVAKSDPGTVIIAKGNRPLELLFHPVFRAAVYASDAKYLRSVQTDVPGWIVLPTKPMHMLVFRADDLSQFERLPFHFVAQRTKSAVLKGGVSV
jgi:glucosamine 6-phosphate synthetase-like amidotransferase/phosphosugar isomerase protein